jgi:hypothetical protein
VYREFVEPAESAGLALPDGALVSRQTLGLQPGEKTFDAVVYPHRAVFAFLNWPRQDQPPNPADACPRWVAGDGYFVFRNRWKDAGDSVVTLRAAFREPILLRSHGLSMVCGRLPGANLSLIETWPDGSAILGSTIIDTHVAIDFSGLSGAEVLVVAVGRGSLLGADAAPSASEGISVNQVLVDNLNARQARVCTVQSGPPPAVRTDGNRMRIGGRVVIFDGSRLYLER